MIETERLIVRPWRDADREPFAAMGQDAEVMRFLGPLMSRAESDAAVDRMMALQAERGHCFWAVERRADGAFLGFCGLKRGPADTPIADDIEIGWRLGRAHWGQGYAREAAAACLDWSWATLNVMSIAAITVQGNSASWGLMERLGMTRRPDEDFDNPNLAPGDPLWRHITYRIARPAAPSAAI